MKKVQQYSIYAILISLFGQVYFFPFNSNFKFSLSVIFLSVILLYRKELNCIILSNSVGVLTFSLRMLASITGIAETTFIEALIHQFPALIYYFTFGVLFYLLDIKTKVDKNYFNLIFLIIIDTTSNVIEMLVRNQESLVSWDVLLLTFVLVAIIRTIFVTAFIYIIEKIKNESKRKKFRELIFLNASLDSELFYLKKSSEDIEKTMHLSYRLYEKLKTPEFKSHALEVSKNIHEIKKDYDRVIDGIEVNLGNINKYVMTSKEMTEIIRKNTLKQINKSKKDITFDFILHDEFNVRKYHPLFTVINNLIINSIQAIDEKGFIRLLQSSDDKNFYFSIHDNGKGITPGEIKVIFEAGYTTKYNEATGHMSKGIGLRHVEDIVQNIFMGKIDVTSKKNECTTFKIRIPKANL